MCFDEIRKCGLDLSNSVQVSVVGPYEDRNVDLGFKTGEIFLKLSK